MQRAGSSALNSDSLPRAFLSEMTVQFGVQRKCFMRVSYSITWNIREVCSQGLRSYKISI